MSIQQIRLGLLALVFYPIFYGTWLFYKDKIKVIRDMSNIAESAGHTIDKFKSDLDLAGL